MAVLSEKDNLDKLIDRVKDALSGNQRYGDDAAKSFEEYAKENFDFATLKGDLVDESFDESAVVDELAGDKDDTVKKELKSLLKTAALKQMAAPKSHIKAAHPKKKDQKLKKPAEQKDDKVKLPTLIARVKCALIKRYFEKGNEIANYFEEYATKHYDVIALDRELREADINSALGQALSKKFPFLAEKEGQKEAGLMPLLKKAVDQKLDPEYEKGYANKVMRFQNAKSQQERTVMTNCLFKQFKKKWDKKYPPKMANEIELDPNMSGDDSCESDFEEARSIAENQLFDDYYLDAFDDIQYYEDDALYALGGQSEFGGFHDAAPYAHADRVWNGYRAPVYGTGSIAVGQVELYYAMEVMAIIFLALGTVFLSCCACVIGFFAVKRWGFIAKNKKRDVEFQPVEQEEYV